MKDTKNGANNILKLRDKLFFIDQPLIMGIVNVTPDSFFLGSRMQTESDILAQVQAMVDTGVDIVDVGGVSTRPRADFVEEKEEVSRVVGAIKSIRKNFPSLIISVDTFRSSVAQLAVEAGADLINDVYAGRLDENLLPTVAKLKVPYVLTHSRGDAKNMQLLTSYDNLVDEVIYELSIVLKQLRELGVNDVIIDPGIGFAKTITQNFELLEHLEAFHVLECPIMLGVSRKSFIYKVLDVGAEKALIGTSMIHTLTLSKNTSIYRVHDVLEMHQIKVLNKKFLELKS